MGFFCDFMISFFSLPGQSETHSVLPTAVCPSANRVYVLKFVFVRVYSAAKKSFYAMTIPTTS